MSLEPGGMETCLFAHHHPCAQPRSDPSRPGDLEELRKFCPAELTRLRGCRYSPAAYPFPYRHPRYGGPTSAVPPVNTDGPRIMGRNSTNAEFLKRGPLSGMYHASGRIHELSSMELRLCTCKYCTLTPFPRPPSPRAIYFLSMLRPGLSIPNGANIVLTHPLRLAGQQDAT